MLLNIYKDRKDNYKQVRIQNKHKMYVNIVIGLNMLIMNHLINVLQDVRIMLIALTLYIKYLEQDVISIENVVRLIIGIITYTITFANNQFSQLQIQNLLIQYLQ